MTNTHEPQSRERPGDAVALVVPGIEAEERIEPEQGFAGRGIAGEQADAQQETDEAADIADRPGGARQPPKRSGGTSRGIIALLNMVANSAPMVPSAKAKTTSGTARASRVRRTTAPPRRRPSIGRRPRSMACGGRSHRRWRREPARTARSSVPRPRSRSPTGLALGRGGGKPVDEVGREDIVVTSVKKGCIDQSNMIQPRMPRREAYAVGDSLTRVGEPVSMLCVNPGEPSVPIAFDHGTQNQVRTTSPWCLDRPLAPFLVFLYTRPKAGVA